VDVGKRLGHEVVGSGLDLLRELLCGDGVDLDGHGRPQRERFESRDEPTLGQYGRVQAARKFTDLVKPRGELIDGEHEQLIGLRRHCAEPAEDEAAPT
jgi:hypothetical protein